MSTAWIPWIEEQDATGIVAEIYAESQDYFGSSSVAPVVKVLSLRPEVAAAVQALRKTVLLGGSTIGARRADLIGTAVSGMNHCEYCGTAHAGYLAKRGDLTEDEAVQIYSDWRKVDLPSEDQVMLRFAEKLTFTPSAMEESDIEELRAAGFSDVNILDIVLTAAYRNFLNRLNDGLGVPRTGHLEEQFGSTILEKVSNGER